MLNEKLSRKNCTTNLVKAINLNFCIMHDKIIKAKNKHMPCKLVKFNKYKHKKSTWITQGLLKSIRYRNKLYKQMRLSNPSSPHYNTLTINLKTYNLILKKSIMSAKQMYCESCFNRYGNDRRSNWKTINEILTKNQTQTIFQQYFKTMAQRYLRKYIL